MQYLADKGRAGVIKLPSSDSAPSRTLYLIPPSGQAGRLSPYACSHASSLSAQVCASLGVPWPTPAASAGCCLLAAVVPTPINSK